MIDDSFSVTVRKLWDLMDPCELCPRKCRIMRSDGRRGYCGVGLLPVVSSVGPHFGEESVLVGSGGSGTIFFAGCNLRCVFCQNYELSHHLAGQEFTVEQLAAAMLDVQERGCVNVNLVTPTHVVPAWAAAIELARKDGLTAPIVFNSGGYDSVETLALIEGFIDIYMPDMKYAESAISLELSSAGNYPRVNHEAVKQMHKQVGDLVIENGLAKRGLLVRHLVLPHNLAGSFEVIDFLVEQVSPNTAINVMDQYRPCYKAPEHTLIDRRPTLEEIRAAEDYARQKGLRVIS